MSEGGSAPVGAAPLPPAISFKVRFAAPREPGRSNVSLVKPRGLPATVAGKPGAVLETMDTVETERRIEEMFACGPRERLPAPLTEAHEYGWWAPRRPAPAPRVLRHHIRDSAWLKARLRVLAADAPLKHT